MKPASEMRAGMVIRLGGDLYRVLQADYHAGGGKMHGAVHAKLRNVNTAGMTERRFRQDERFEELTLERQAVQFLYQDGDQCVFMHPTSFEQMVLPSESLGPFLPFLEPDQTVDVELLEGAPVEVRTPDSVEVRVATTPEPLHLHDSSVPKDATLDNGIEIQVPQFIKPGDRIRIEVATGKYLERVT